MQIAVTRDQRAEVEFARGVEAAIVLRQRLPQQPVGADHRRPVAEGRVARGMIEHQEVVAERSKGSTSRRANRRPGLAMAEPSW